jgi:DNA-binding GntR family transcriptional regulator
VNLGDVPLLYPLLGALMAYAVEQSVPRLEAADLTSLARANDRMLEAAVAGDAIGSRRADHEFHAVFVQRADNHYLAGATDMLELHVRRLETAYFADVAGVRTSHAEHAAIIAAAAGGDGELAGRLTRDNYERSGRDLLERGKSGEPVAAISPTVSR